jgi:hypothetical protein
MDPSQRETATTDLNLATLAIARRLYPLRVLYDDAARRTTFLFPASVSFDAVCQEFAQRSAVLPFEDTMGAVKTVRRLMREAREGSAA